MGEMDGRVCVCVCVSSQAGSLRCFQVNFEIEFSCFNIIGHCQIVFSLPPFMSKPQKDECEVIRSPVKLKEVFRNHHISFTFHLSKHTFTHFRKIEKNHEWNIKITLFPSGQSVIYNHKQKQNQTWLRNLLREDDNLQYNDYRSHISTIISHLFPTKTLNIAVS